MSLSKLACIAYTLSLARQKPPKKYHKLHKKYHGNCSQWQKIFLQDMDEAFDDLCRKHGFFPGSAGHTDFFKDLEVKK